MPMLLCDPNRKSKGKAVKSNGEQGRYAAAMDTIYDSTMGDVRYEDI